MIELPNNPPNYNVVSQAEQTPESESDPPSYFDLFGQLKTVNENSATKIERVTSTIKVLSQSVYTTCFMLALSILPICQLFIGLANSDKCPVEPRIPLWLQVNGACFIAFSLIEIVKSTNNCVYRGKDHTEPSKQAILTNFIASLLIIFLLVWFGLGNFWIYGAYPESLSVTNESTNYCDNFLYLFAFWSITSAWILIGLVALCCCSYFGLL